MTTMTESNLVDLCRKAIKSFEKDIKHCEKHGMYEDRAYAEGARNAYQFLLDKLTECHCQNLDDDLLEQGYTCFNCSEYNQDVSRLKKENK